ncbi:DUF4168 domain-containing protein [Gracilimonas sp.]|uniref:DUF4168 domain-containing protein n=1 Tax=Gracilimonas sp. TaxID=1974203 RepID=UPI0037531339
MRYTFIVFLGLIFSTATVFAQQQQMPPQPEPLSPEEVTDEHLEKVSNVAKAGESIQKEAQEKMESIVDEVGMEFSRFQEIMMAQQNPQIAGQMELTSEEQKYLQEIQPKLMEVTQEINQKYMVKIEEEGLTVQRFQQITQAIQAHQVVAERFEKINNPDSEEDNENE